MRLSKVTLLFIAIMTCSLLWAESSYSDLTIGDLANNIRKNLSAVVTLAIVVAYMAGVFFFISGIIKFKAHKDNPTQVPLSAPVVMILIAACLLYFPTLIEVSGKTVFNNANANSGADYLDPNASNAEIFTTKK